MPHGPEGILFQEINEIFQGIYDNRFSVSSTYINPDLLVRIGLYELQTSDTVRKNPLGLYRACSDYDFTEQLCYIDSFVNQCSQNESLNNQNLEALLISIKNLKKELGMTNSETFESRFMHSRAIEGFENTLARVQSSVCHSINTAANKNTATCTAYDKEKRLKAIVKILQSLYDGMNINTSDRVVFLQEIRKLKAVSKITKELISDILGIPENSKWDYIFATMEKEYPRRMTEQKKAANK